MSQDQSLDVSRSADAAAVQQTGTRSGHVAGSRLLLLLSALVGGALTWLLLQSIYPIFTVSEENDSFHVFENGRIMYSL